MSSETIYSGKKYHYVYRITNTVEHKYYYGAHSCNDLNTEAIGVKYLSTSLDKDFIKDQKVNPSHYQYKIIRFFKTREDAISFEIYLHHKFDVKNHPSFYNNANQKSTGFDTTGKVSVKDKDGKIYQVSVDDPRYISGELAFVMKGFVVVKDKMGNTMSVPVDDPRYISGELVPIWTGKSHSRETKNKMRDSQKGIVIAKDQKGNIVSIDKNDQRWVTGELVGICKGTLNVKDKDGNVMRVSKDDPRYISGELISIMIGKVPVKDQYGNNFLISVDDPRYLSGELISIMTGKKLSEDTKAKIRKKCQGKNASQYGTIWITNGKIIKKIKKDETIPEGFIRGRRFSL